jgi:GNAT superfamily N-acetyltransferase
MPQIIVRRIGPLEGATLRDLRLRSLRDAPEAFGQNVVDAAARDDQDWQQQARQASYGDRRAWFIAEDEAHHRFGLVQGRRRPPSDLLIFSMWVDPAQRRSGVGRQLIDGLEEWSRTWGATHSVLWVFGTNEPAIRFYRRLGFEVEPDSADADSGRTYGALAMSRPVRPDA